ncbi:choice-of-anchor P family protein [Actinokineospora sp.]|uniref:choice-of-anchor P family protein n=1 Tax=Actinokineospora sp. TaxID=1872133 RepID=UPI003D6ADA2F
MRRRLSWIVAVLTPVAIIVPAQTAEAATDTFTCRASGVRVTAPIINSEPIVSNKPGNPCVDDFDALATVAVPPLVSTGIVVTNTDVSPGGAQGANSTAVVNNLVINVGAVVIRARVLHSEAAATCGPTGPKLTGYSQVAGLSINGTPINVIDQPVTIPANPLVVVAINEQTVTPGKITQRALHVRSALLGVDIAISESIAGFSGNPCQAPKPQCSDTADNDGDGKVDATDPGCHTDGNPDNPDSYDPNDNDETDVPKTQCNDGVDNDDDKLTDAEDPGCHTDGNPDNPASYDPSDNDEFNDK